MKKLIFINWLTIVIIFLSCVSAYSAPTHVWVDQNNGINNSSTIGSEENPFKSITYALMIIEDDLIVLHIKAGIYDSNDPKEPKEKEYFPIKLRNKIVVQGESGKENCVISGNENSNNPIFYGENLTNITIKNITLMNMQRTGGTKNGGGIELINCSGTIQNCTFTDNIASGGNGGAIWLTSPDVGNFNILNCSFNNNLGSYGGAVYIKGDVISESFMNNTFDSNSNGGLYIEGNWKIYNNFTNNNFLNNTGYPAVLIYGNMEIANRSFSENTFKNNNFRGLIVYKDLIADIKNNIFIKNVINDHGAGFYVHQNVDGEIVNNQFLENSAGSHHGASFYINGNLSNNISNNIFDSNNAYYCGGFYVVGQMDAHIFNNIFRNNACTHYSSFIVTTLYGNIFQNTIHDSNDGALSITYLNGDIYNNVITGVNGSHLLHFHEIIGKVFNNIITNNNTSSRYMFNVRDKFIGSITNNQFVNNSTTSYGILSFNCLYEGRIEKNLFSHNISYEGGAIYLAFNGGDAAIISNNYFIHNSISANVNANGDKLGSGIHSNQNVAIIHNTFIGNIDDSSMLSFGSTSTNSIVKNNIFNNCYTAILEEGKLSFPIEFNDFYGIEKDIIKRNNESYGNDLGFIHDLNPLAVFVKSNIDSLPNFVGNMLDKGSWTKDAYYQPEQNCTVFTDSTKNWNVNQWKGSFINISGIPDKEYYFVILSNTKNEVILANNLIPTGFGNLDSSYTVDDYRLKSNSLLKEAATENISNIDITQDFEGEYRPQDSRPDIGADEFFTGKIAPSILSADLPATEISASSAILNARLNALGKKTSYYFEYGITKNYGNNTIEKSVGEIQDYTTVQFLITSLEQDTLYHFRLVASNADVTGGAMGPDQTFKTLRTNVVIKGNIKGTIAGHNSLNVKNAIIKLQGTTYEAQTDSNGDFLLNDVVPGNYSLIIQSPGFVTVTQNMELTEGDTVTLDNINLSAPSTNAIEAEVDKERLKWDALNDYKKGLPEAIEALKVSSDM